MLKAVGTQGDVSDSLPGWSMCTSAHARMMPVPTVLPTTTAKGGGAHAGATLPKSVSITPPSEHMKMMKTDAACSSKS